MSRHRLRSFLAVAGHLHFGRAAQSLHISQQALSSAIRRLEEDLGVPLFERDTRHVVLTPAGRVLAEEAVAVIGDVDRLVARVRAAGRPDSATLHVTIGTGAEATALVNRVADALRDRH